MPHIIQTLFLQLDNYKKEFPNQDNDREALFGAFSEGIVYRG